MFDVFFSPRRWRGRVEEVEIRMKARLAEMPKSLTALHVKFFGPSGSCAIASVYLRAQRAKQQKQLFFLRINT